MFVCRACLRKGLGALPYARTTETRLVTSLRTLRNHGFRRRTFATVSQPPARIETNDVTKAVPDDHEDSPSMKRLEWVVNKHLQYLKDPKLIADHVKATLQKDKFLEALLLTRKASRNTKVTVSWNHLIDYQMKQQRLHAAIKLYNEMKKRGQKPDATTYTVIFRGCASSNHPKLAVSEALRIYNKMISVGEIKPNMIHFNAVLDVCSRAGDIESLFGVVSTATEGLRNPNNWSYTIIFNALRYQAWDTKDMTPEDIRNNKQLAITRARTIWEEVMERWRDGKVMVDEQLVCAMGRVLATGDKLENDSILELLEQTMEIPNFNKTANQAALPKPAEEESATQEITATPTSTEGESGDSPQPKQPEVISKPKPTTKAPVAKRSSSNNFTYPKPSNNTLSLLLTSIANTRKTSIAPRYWEYMTKTLNIVPDKDNYVRYVQVLAKAHNSTKAAEVIPTIPSDCLNPMIYRVAFTCCAFDSQNNPQAFEHAKTIFRDMVKRTRVPDPLSMRIFLNTARGNDLIFKKQMETDPNAGKLALGLQIVTALDMLWAPFRVLGRSFNFPQTSKPLRNNIIKSPEQEHILTNERKKEMLHTARKMVAAYDWVLQGALTPPDKMAAILKARKTILIQMIERFTLKMERAERSMERMEAAARPEEKGNEKEEEEDNWEEVEEERRSDNDREFNVSRRRVDDSFSSSSFRGGSSRSSSGASWRERDYGHSRDSRTSSDRGAREGRSDRGRGDRGDSGKRDHFSVYKTRNSAPDKRDLAKLRRDLGKRL
ncbi:hypothetical protein V8F06_001091 [Rhypophila decipiens]